MSEESLDSTIRAFYDALERRDLTVLDEVASPDVVVKEAPGTTPEGRTYRGREEVRAFVDSLFKFWAQVNFDVLRIVWADESRVVIAVRGTYAGRGTGVEVTTDSGNLASSAMEGSCGGPFIGPWRRPSKPPGCGRRREVRPSSSVASPSPTACWGRRRSGCR
jgi:ketosteroid isomerase-like protein